MKKVVTTFQSELNECGLACLAMILSYFGRMVDLSYLRELIPNRDLGVTLDVLLKVAEREGLNVRPIKISISELRHLHGPALLHWNMDHFVVLERCRGSKFIIHDPSVGKRTITLDEIDEKFTGVAVEFDKSDAFQKGEFRSTLYIFMLWSKIEGIFKFGVLLLFFSLCLYALTFLLPILLQTALDLLIFESNSILKIVILSFVMIVICVGLIQIARSYLLVTLGRQLKFKLGKNLIVHLFSLPLQYFSMRSVGDITSRIDSLDAIRRQLTDSFLETIIDFGLVITSLVLMYRYSPTLSFIALLTVILIVTVSALYFYPRKFQLSREVMVNDAKEISSLIESLNNIHAIKYAQAELHRKSIWLNIFSVSISKESEIEKLTAVELVITALATSLMYVFSVYYIVLGIQAEHISIGVAVAYLSFQTIFMSQTKKVVASVQQLFTLKIHFERLSDLVQEEPESNVGKKLNLKGKIEFKNVYFKYNQDDEWLLENINFVIDECQHIAITGSSGCGKSTLLKLIRGEVSDFHGEILLDGISIREISLQSLRSSISSFLQGDTTILNGTFEENITFFENEPNMQKVRSACIKANILSKINSFPLGLNSKINEGKLLSGGEIQRVVLARSLYKDSSILLLDEATSNLDIENESYIYDNIHELNSTVISVAHSKVTLSNANKIYHLENKKLIDTTKS